MPELSRAQKLMQEQLGASQLWGISGPAGSVTKRLEMWTADNRRYIVDRYQGDSGFELFAQIKPLNIPNCLMAVNQLDKIEKLLDAGIYDPFGVLNRLVVETGDWQEAMNGERPSLDMTFKDAMEVCKVLELTSEAG